MSTPSARYDRQAFRAFLEWLDGSESGSTFDERRAGEKYEELRRKLLKFFYGRSCGTTDSEALADATVDRVVSKISALGHVEASSRSAYVLGVARFILMEHRRSPRYVPLPDNVPLPSPPREDRIEALRCLSRCLSQLPAEEARIVMDYYRSDKQAKIQERREIAAAENRSSGDLRVHVFRIRQKLVKCVKACVSGRA